MMRKRGIGLALGFGAVLVLQTGVAWSRHLTEDLTAGEEIFNRTCVECHGQDGRGSIEGAPDFTKKDGRLTKHHAVLLTHILEGYQSPGSPAMMPPKGRIDDLTFQEIRNVLAFLYKSFLFEGNDLVAGAEIYNHTCVECHGQDGRGAIEGAPDFTVKDGRLAKPSAVLITHILEGFQSPGSPAAMPPKGDNEQLTVREVRNVLAFLRQYYHYKTFASAGEEVYFTSCVGCHGEDGTGGIPGTPDFTLERGVLALPDNLLIKHITEGYSSGEAAMPMPPKGGDDDLTIRQLWEVLAYMHQHFHYKIVE